jgi:Fur family ferric uptake transcriptional regulator
VPDDRLPNDRLTATLEAIRRGGGRVTPAREAVIEAVLDADHHHFTAADIFEAVEGGPARPDRATVYRTLDLLIELGVLTPLQLDAAAVVYHRTDHSHAHLICEGCGAVVELDRPTLDAIDRAVAKRTGFTIDRPRVAIAGRCASCGATRAETPR